MKTLLKTFIIALMVLSVSSVAYAKKHTVISVQEGEETNIRFIVTYEEARTGSLIITNVEDFDDPETEVYIIDAAEGIAKFYYLNVAPIWIKFNKERCFRTYKAINKDEALSKTVVQEQNLNIKTDTIKNVVKDTLTLKLPASDTIKPAAVDTGKVELDL